MMPTLFVLNGPNLNLLGLRETHIYGKETLEDIKKACLEAGARRQLKLDFRQTNYEGELVEWIQEARTAADAILINAAAYTHTSVAVHDALRAFDGYKVELHISNPHVREEFRHHSYVSYAVDAIVAGLGTPGYGLAVDMIGERLAGRHS